MTETPSPYDIIQDGRIEGLEDLVTPHYEPPSSSEHSFPVVDQGVNSEMYRQMSLAQGDGILITDGSESPYILVGMPGGDSETNATNRMILKVASNTGRAEAVISGFYHVLYQDRQIELPPVSTPTTYYVTLTYDPRKEDEPNGPVRVEVFTNDVPRQQGQRHIVLHTIQRQPNQLLTDAARGLYRQYISPTITVTSVSSLPNPTDVLYGTIAVVRSRTSGGNVVPGTAQLFESRGTHGWHNLLVGPWQTLELRNGWVRANIPSTPQYRYTPFGIELRGRPAPGGATSRFFAALPQSLATEFRFSPQVNPYGANVAVAVNTSGNFEVVYNSRGAWADLSWLSLDGLTIPLN